MKNVFNPRPYLEAAQLIEDTDTLSMFCDSISDTDIIAVDIESAAFFKYYARVNLVQVATRNHRAILDPQKIKSFKPFDDFLKNSKAEWIFHGGDYDIAMLAVDLGLYVYNMFDTKKAAELLGIKELGLGSLAEKLLGITLNKKLQRCDWSRRPLTPEMREYALLDAICLIPIYDYLKAELINLNRLEWLKQECEQIAEHARQSHINTKKPFAYRIKGSSKFSNKSLGVLREVWNLREAIAEKLDRATFMIMSNQTLLEIAKRIPLSLLGLSTIKGLNDDFLKKYGKEIQSAIRKGLEVDPAELKIPEYKHDHILQPWEGELAKSLKEIRNVVAERLKIAPPLLASSHAISELAIQRPQTKGELEQSEILHKWQVELLADDFLAILSLESLSSSKNKKKQKKQKK